MAFWAASSLALIFQIPQLGLCILAAFLIQSFGLVNYSLTSPLLPPLKIKLGPV